jgi:predicted RNase H-like nuclease (RuvC/YqgF family)
MFNNKLKQQIFKLQQDNYKLSFDLESQRGINKTLKQKCDEYESVSNNLTYLNDTIKIKQSELSDLQSQIDNVESVNYIHTLGFYDIKNDSKYYVKTIKKLLTFILICGII